MKFTFWGVRGSIPSPSTNRFSTLKYGGNTTCVSVEFPNHFAIVDAGTGIRELGMRANKFPSYLLFFSHFHHDHVQGFPFFYPVYNPKIIVFYFTPRIMRKRVDKVLEEQFNPPLFPYRFEYTFSAKKFFVISPMDSVRLLNVKSDSDYVESLMGGRKDSRQLERLKRKFPDGFNAHVLVPAYEPKLNNEVGRIDFIEILSHPNHGSFTYGFIYNDKKIVFATDLEQRAEGIAKLVKYAQNADVLIHDTQYLPEDYYEKYQDFGHSTYEMAGDVAKKAGVKKLILTHHDPAFDDDKIDKITVLARNYMSKINAANIEIESAYEGMVIDFS